MENSKHWNYKNQNIETKYFNNMQKTQFLKVKNGFLGLKKDFTELKDIEIKVKREIDELYFKPIIGSIDDLDKFEWKEMGKKALLKSLGIIG